MTGRVSSLSLCATLFLGGVLFADQPSGKETASFGTLRALDPAEARKQADSWLRTVKTDAATTEKFKQIWDSDHPVLDKLAATFILAEPGLTSVLSDARNADAPAPLVVPPLLTDKTKPTFYRGNLALAYGKALTSRGVYEEALEAFAAVKPEEVADPAALYFHKAVCEHSLMLKDRADGSIDRLLVDVVDAPERYRMVAALMHFDMLTWQEKDLGWIARKMGNIQRRLDLKRGGKETQKQQKEVLVRLDEMIKELENKQNQGGS
jgi:hypothetical protein